MVSSTNALILVITFAYLLVVLGVGYLASRVTERTRQDYLMANRTFGTVVQLFALFATNMTAVVMIGAPGLAYQVGIGAYGWFVGLFSVLFPVLLVTVGYRFWLVGQAYEFITPSQFLNHRWDSDHVGGLVTLLFTVWTVPFVLTGIMGGGIAFQGLTNGFVPFWAGSLVVVVVVGLYLYPSGMRGTGWTNTFQGAVFMVILLGIFVTIATRIGGFGEATRAVAEINNGTFLNRAGIPPLQSRTWFSAGLVVTLGAFVYPHLMLRYMTAKSAKVLKRTGVLYPVAIVLVWVPAVSIGFWGIAQLPDIPNPDLVLPLMIAEFLPPWVLGFALAGILAAVMSSIDGMILTLSTLFSEDLLREYTDVPEEREVWYTRVFLVAIVGLAYVGSLVVSQTIIDLAIFFISGYATMFFPIVSAFYSKRSNEVTAIAGLVFGFVALWAFFFDVLPGSLTFGFLPIVPVLVGQLVVMVVVAALTSPPPEERVEEYDELFERLGF